MSYEQCREDLAYRFHSDTDESPAEPEEFESRGRYDGEPMLQKRLREVWQLRMACQAQQHKLGELTLNLSTNIMACSHCGEAFDLNELVDPALKTCAHRYRNRIAQ